MDRFVAMNLRHKRPPDSLFMLLDTICDTFGGILLLAVLVTLLTSRENENHAGATSENVDFVKRQLEIAETNLRQALNLSTRLETKAGDSRWKEQIELIATRKDLQQQLQQVDAVIARKTEDIRAVAATDPSERAKYLNQRMADAQLRQSEAQNRLAAANQNLQHLKQRQADLKHQIASKIQETERPLRLPREHETGKDVVYIIARFGLIYPCRNGDLSRNETSIEWGFLGTADPIPGKGLPPDAMDSYFAELSRSGVYVVFCAFADSFPAFMQARQTAVARGLSYGWEPFRIQDGPVTFSSHGHVPKPQ
jgi:hypothetical protein